MKKENSSLRSRTGGARNCRIKEKEKEGEGEFIITKEEGQGRNPTTCDLSAQQDISSLLQSTSLPMMRIIINGTRRGRLEEEMRRNRKMGRNDEGKGVGEWGGLPLLELQCARRDWSNQSAMIGLRLNPFNILAKIYLG